MQDPRFWILVLGILGAIALFNWSLDRWTKAKMRAAGEALNARQKAECEQQAKERDAFLKSAKLMRAKVLSTHQEGMVNLKPNLCMSLRVEAPDGAYDVEVEQHVEYVDLHRFAKGSMVDVLVDPANREHVALCDPEIADMRRETEAMLEDGDKPLGEDES